MLYEDTPQLLDRTEQGLASLLDQNAAQQYTERADISTERKVFGWIRGASGQLVEPAALVVSSPKGAVTHIQS